MKIVLTSQEYSLIKSVIMDIKGMLGDEDPIGDYNKDICSAGWINDFEFQIKFEELFITKAIHAGAKYLTSVICAVKALLPAAEAFTKELDAAANECAEAKRKKADKERFDKEYAEIQLKIAEAEKKLENLRIKRRYAV